MKKGLCLILFLILTVSAFAQQFLWSTVSGNDSKYVSINNVTREVLTFYDQYQYYFDFSGFSKDRFIDFFDYGFEDWDWLYDIEELTVFALRSNSGRGSVVLVMCISKNNVNTIVFSNTYDRDAIRTYEFEKQKFTNWFRTILN